MYINFLLGVRVCVFGGATVEFDIFESRFFDFEEVGGEEGGEGEAEEEEEEEEEEGGGGEGEEEEDGEDDGEPFTSRSAV